MTDINLKELPEHAILFDICTGSGLTYATNHLDDDKCEDTKCITIGSQSLFDRKFDRDIVHLDPKIFILESESDRLKHLDIAQVFDIMHTPEVWGVTWAVQAWLRSSYAQPHVVLEILLTVVDKIIVGLNLYDYVFPHIRKVIQILKTHPSLVELRQAINPDVFDMLFERFSPPSSNNSYHDIDVMLLLNKLIHEDLVTEDLFRCPEYYLTDFQARKYTKGYGLSTAGSQLIDVWLCEPKWDRIEGKLKSIDHVFEKIYTQLLNSGRVPRLELKKESQC